MKMRIGVRPLETAASGEAPRASPQSLSNSEALFPLLVTIWILFMAAAGFASR